MTHTSVYWIHHPSHEDMFTQGYIGVSSNVSARFTQHRGKSQNPHLTHAIQKYGWDNLIKQVLLVGPKQYCLDIEKKLRSVKSTGWNVVVGGGHPPVAYGNNHALGMTPWNKGVPMTAEAKAKASTSHMGCTVWNKGLEGVQVAWNKGRKSLAPSPRKGAVHSAEVRARISAGRKGIRLSNEVYARQALARTGVKQKLVTCPHCATVGGAATMPRWHFNNCKEYHNGQ